MKVYTAQLESIAPYSQSRFHNMPKLEKELADAYEQRTWREHCHYAPDGHVQIPPMALKNCISEAAQYLGIQIAGRGKERWTKHFRAGIMIFDPLPLPYTRKDLQAEWVHCNADGKKGSGTRVLRCFPFIPEWKGNVIIHVVDDIITEEILRQHIDEAGKLVGIGRFRPANGGYYGRFICNRLTLEKK